jgi:hypothetical protein
MHDTIRPPMSEVEDRMRRRTTLVGSALVLAVTVRGVCQAADTSPGAHNPWRRPRLFQSTPFVSQRAANETHAAPVKLASM